MRRHTDSCSGPGAAPPRYAPFAQPSGRPPPPHAPQAPPPASAQRVVPVVNPYGGSNPSAPRDAAAVTAWSQRPENQVPGYEKCYAFHVLGTCKRGTGCARVHLGDRPGCASPAKAHTRQR